MTQLTQYMAIVDTDNKVVNVVVYDTGGNWTPPEGTRIIQSGVLDRDNAEPGSTWNGKKFFAPVPGSAAAPSIEERLKALEAQLKV